jgi:Ca-activated chloride channel homolog
MVRRFVLFLVAACGASSSVVSQQESSIFRVDVEMVMLNVAVTDSRGTYITGLQPDDFQIYEDGIAQTIATFAEGNRIPRRASEFTARNSQPHPVSSSPAGGPSTGSLAAESGTPPQSAPGVFAGANVFLLFDTSNYMYRGFVYAQDAISDFVRSLDGADRVALYPFSRDVKRAAPIGTDRQQVLRAVRSAVAGDDIALYNALLVTLGDASQISGRKVVLVFSNGPDTSSMAAPESVRELAQSEGIPIYVISTHEAKNDPESAAVFERLSTTTGGKAYFAKKWQEQQKAFTLIREDLAHLFMLSYYPQPNPNRGWRSITVKLVGERLKKYHVRTRIGYRPKPGQNAGRAANVKP